MSELGGGINNLGGNLGGSQDLYMVFIDATTSGSGADSQVRYGVSFNNSTGEILNSTTQPPNAVLDYFTDPGVSFPADFSGLAGNFDTINIQSAGSTMGTCWPGGGSALDKNNDSLGDFGVCTGSSYGNFLEGGTSFITLNNNPSLMPYKVYLSDGT